MKKRILALLLTVMMVMSVIVIPTSAATIPETPKYSWDGFIEGDMRAYYDDQVADLGFKGPIASAPTLDGEIADGEYSIVHRIPFLYNSDTSGKYKPETEVTDYYIDANFAVNGDYLYVAVDQTDGPALGSNDPTERVKVQFDIGVAANSSAESTWNRITIAISADGTVSATTGFMVHEVGATEYAQGRNGLRAADYLVEQTFDFGVYELKFDLGQLYRLFSNHPGGQQAWDTPCVNFAMWFYSGRTNAEGADHYVWHVSPNFKNANGRGGNWVSTTVLIPDTTLDALEAKYKGVIGPLGYDYRNAVAGQLITVDEYATVTPTVDGILSDEDGYTTKSAWSGTHYQSTTGDLNAHLSVKDGYLYGAIVCNTNVFGSKAGYLTAFGGIDSSFLRDSRVQTKINVGGAWAGDQGGMWKVAQGPATATKVNTSDNTKTASNNWTSKELNVDSSKPANAWKNVATSYDANTDTTTVEFQLSIPALLAILKFEGYNPEEANAVQLGFWATSIDGSNYAYYTVPSNVQTQIKQHNGYSYGCATVIPMVGLPKGCAELYCIDDVDDMGAFGQRIIEAKQSVANVDGTIGAGEYTASNHFESNELTSYNSKKAHAYDISQTDYYSYDENYFYYGAKVYDPYYKAGSSSLQMNLSVLNKHEFFTVTNTYTTVSKNATTGVYTESTKTVKTLRENYIDIADVITRASWGNTLYDDYVGTSAASKPGCVIRSQTLTNGTLAADAQAAFKERASTFGDAGYEFDGSYDAATKTYTFEAKIPLDELKILFQLDDKFDIESINIYTLYKFTEPDTGTVDHAMTYQLRSTEMQVAWEALRTLTIASMGVYNAAKPTPYNENTVPNVIKFVDEAFTKDTASVRISTSVSGLRFKSVYTNDYLAYMAKYAAIKGETMEIGTLIAPNDYVTAAGAFTHAALSAKYGANGYVEVPAVQADPFQNVNGVTTFAGSLVNIKEGNLARDFAGIGYIKIGSEYFYADGYAVKNVSDIASAALADTKATQQGAYKYEVEAGVWSPYTEGQRLVLGNLVA